MNLNLKYGVNKEVPAVSFHEDAKSSGISLNEEFKIFGTSRLIVVDFTWPSLKLRVTVEIYSLLSIGSKW